MADILNKFTDATGAEAVDISLSAPKGNRLWRLNQFTVHLSKAGGSGNLTVTIDSSSGAAYDFVIYTKDMATETDLFWATPIILQADDVVKIAWANAGGATYGIQCVTEVIY